MIGPRIRVVVATGWLGRMRGLLGRPQPSPGRGMLFIGESAVHGFGMRWSLDLVFLDGAGRIVGCDRLPVNRIRWHRGARQVLELRSGEIDRLGLVPGMRPILTPVSSIADRSADRSRAGAAAILAGSMALLLAGPGGDACAADRMGKRMDAWESDRSAAPAPAAPWRLPAPPGSLARPSVGVAARPLSAETVRQLFVEAEALYRLQADEEALLTYRSLAGLDAGYAAQAGLRIGNIHQRAGAVGPAIDAYRLALAPEAVPDAAESPAEREARRKALLNLSSLALEQSRLSLARLETLPDVSDPVTATDVTTIHRDVARALQARLSQLSPADDADRHPLRPVGPAAIRPAAVRSAASGSGGRTEPTDGRFGSAAPPRIEYLHGDPSRALRRSNPGTADNRLAPRAVR